MRSASRWAEEEFGDAQLPNRQNVVRLVEMASDVSRRPAGTVTQAFGSSASREGAFRFLENFAIRVDAVRECVQGATARRCAARERVIVAVDATSLQITDRKKKKRLGPIGSVARGARGVHAMTALALTPSGAPLGILGQELWVRPDRSSHSVAKRKQRADSGESVKWLTALDDSVAALGDVATTPWFQLDRGGDCWQVLEHAKAGNLLLTVRAAQDRRVDGSADRLWSAVESTQRVAALRVDLPARPRKRRKVRRGGHRRVEYIPARRARVATVEVRAATVSLVVTTAEGDQVLPFNVVLLREKNAPAKQRVEWLLLTTHPIATPADAMEVARAYTLRWRVEDFHRAWKSGVCHVEDTQLRSRQAIFKWATLLASVATRAMRLTHQARTTPDAPATSELSDYELEALIALRRPKKLPDGRAPTLAEAVRWIAELGGYTGPWNGPPGTTTVGRGLHDVVVAAIAFENRDKNR